MIGGKDLALEVAHSMEKISKKQSLYENKIALLKGEVKNLNDKKKILLTQINEIKNKEPMPYKKLGELFKTLKENNAQGKEFERQMLGYYKDLKELSTLFKELNWERSKFETKIGTLERKKQFVSFMESNLNQRASKTDFQTLFEVKRDILLNEKIVDEKVLDKVKASLIVSKLLGKKNNAFDLINSYKELEYNLNALKKSNAELENRKEFEQRLENNQKLILGLIIERFNSLDKDLSLSNERLKVFQINEFEKVSVFLNKDTQAKLNALRQKIQTNESADRQNKAKRQTIQPNFKPQASKSTLNEQADEIQKPQRASKNIVIDDMSKLDEPIKQAFIAWLIQKRQLKNVKFYQSLFTQQLDKNEMKNFKELFKEFSSHSQNIGVQK